MICQDFCTSASAPLTRQERRVLPPTFLRIMEWLKNFLSCHWPLSPPLILRSHPPEIWGRCVIKVHKYLWTTNITLLFSISRCQEPIGCQKNLCVNLVFQEISQCCFHHVSTILVMIMTYLGYCLVCEVQCYKSIMQWKGTASFQINWSHM